MYYAVLDSNGFIWLTEHPQHVYGTCSCGVRGRDEGCCLSRSVVVTGLAGFATNRITRLRTNGIHKNVCGWSHEIQHINTATSATTNTNDVSNATTNTEIIQNNISNTQLHYNISWNSMAHRLTPKPRHCAYNTSWLLHRYITNHSTKSNTMWYEPVYVTDHPFVWWTHLESERESSWYQTTQCMIIHSIIPDANDTYIYGIYNVCATTN